MKWIYNSFSGNKLEFLFGNAFAYGYWISLTSKFHDNSSSNPMQLRPQLQTLRKNDKTMDKNMEEANDLFDYLKAIGDSIFIRK